MLPGKVKGNIAKLEQLKSKQPELASVIDKRLPALHKRLGFFREPVKALEEALGRICTTPAHSQKLLFFHLPVLKRCRQITRLFIRFILRLFC